MDHQRPLFPPSRYVGNSSYQSNILPATSKEMASSNDRHQSRSLQQLYPVFLLNEDHHHYQQREFRHQSPTQTSSIDSTSQPGPAVINSHRDRRHIQGLEADPEKHTTTRPSSAPASVEPEPQSPKLKFSSLSTGPLIVGGKIKEHSPKKVVSNLNPLAATFTPRQTSVTQLEGNSNKNYISYKELAQKFGPASGISVPSHRPYTSYLQPAPIHMAPRGFLPPTDVYLGLDPALDPEHRLRPRYANKPNVSGKVPGPRAVYVPGSGPSTAFGRNGHQKGSKSGEYGRMRAPSRCSSCDSVEAGNGKERTSRWSRY